jgi:transcriptional regulator with XRE-family HTH domain
MSEESLPTPPSVAAVIRRLRRQRNLSLEELAQQSGVSRSMLSQIERDATNPTVATLWRITTALGVSIDEALGLAPRRMGLEVWQAHALPKISSADGLMVLKVLSPLDTAGAAEWYEITAQPLAVLRSKAHTAGTQEHLYVTEGELTVTSGEDTQRVAAGAMARYHADVPHVIHNASASPAKAWLTVLQS